MPAGAQDATGRVPASQIIKSTVRAFILNCQMSDAPDGDPMGIPILNTCQALSAGSGTIISQQGLILTNAHVALNRETGQPQWLLIALTTDPRELPTPAFFARSHIYDAAVDLAIVEPTYTLDGRPIEEGDVNLLPLTMNQTEEGVELEQPLRLIGYPIVGGNTITINPAVVSGFSPDQNVPELAGGAWIKTDPAGGAGISGGTAVNDDGILVGVPSAAGLAEIRCLDLDGDGDTEPASECAATAGETGLSRPIPEAYDLLLQKAEAAGQLENNGNGNGTDPTPTPDDTNPEPPDEGVIITGRIVSADTGDPIQGAYVYVFQPGITLEEAIDRQNRDDIYTYGQTDGTGTFILNDPVARDQAYSIIFQAPGYNARGGDDLVLATSSDPATKDLGTIELPSAQ
jgi:hypothetical protein